MRCRLARILAFGIATTLGAFGNEFNARPILRFLEMTPFVVAYWLLLVKLGRMPSK